MSLAESVKKDASAPVIINESTNKSNKIITIVVITTGEIFVSNSIEEKNIVIRNVIFVYNSNIVTEILYAS